MTPCIDDQPLCERSAFGCDQQGIVFAKVVTSVSHSQMKSKVRVATPLQMDKERIGEVVAEPLLPHPDVDQKIVPERGCGQSVAPDKRCRSCVEIGGEPVALGFGNGGVERFELRRKMIPLSVGGELRFDTASCKEPQREEDAR